MNLHEYQARGLLKRSGVPVPDGDVATSPEEVEETKKLIEAQIQAGYTSFAIDPSHLYNFEGGNLREELAKNIDVTTELAKFIESKMAGKPFGLFCRCRLLLYHDVLKDSRKRVCLGFL